MLSIPEEDLARIEEEHAFRIYIWHQLLNAGGPRNLSPGLVRDLGIHKAQQGIWTDKGRTHPLTQDGAGVTVAVRHHGNRYADDLSDDGVLYHYPVTDRRGKDKAEISATKNAAWLKLPIFVVITPEENTAVREVRLGWVEDYDDEAQIFLITFGEEPTTRQPEAAEEEPFSLIDSQARRKKQVTVRDGQQRFKFRVLKRYGSQCAACGIDLPQVLDAAHIYPKGKSGSDDPRNGLPLCALHHRAFDAALFAIHPDTLHFVSTTSDISLEELRITKPSLKHLPVLPHHEALEWRWRWRGP